MAATECFDFDEALLPEDSWSVDLEEGEFEVEKIVDVRSARKTRYGRIHRQFQVFGKDPEPTWIDEADLNCRALLYEFKQDRVRRNRFEMMQSHEGESRTSGVEGRRVEGYTSRWYVSEERVLCVSIQIELPAEWLRR